MRAGFNGNILVVDDEAMIHDVMRETLGAFLVESSFSGLRLFGSSEQDGAGGSGSSVEIDCVFRGRDALEKVANSLRLGRPYAAVFLDINMPGLNGFETARQLREIDARVEVIFMTAHDMFSSREISEQIGRDALFLCKPFQADEIRQVAMRSLYSWNQNRFLEDMVIALAELPLDDSTTETYTAKVGAVIHGFYPGASLFVGTLDCNRLHEQFVTGLFKGGEELRALEQLVVASGTGVHLSQDRVWMARGGWVVALRRPDGEFRKDERFTLEILFRNSLLKLENHSLRASLAEKERLSAMGDAVRMVVHDLKTPLAAIQGLAELATQGQAQPPRTPPIPQLISRAARNGMGLCIDILSYADGARMERETVSVAALFDDVRLAIEPYLQLAPKELLFQPVAQNLLLDRRRMVRVLVNLVRNSFDAIEGAERVNGRVLLGAACVGQDVSLWVEDNGPGMPAAMVKDLFNALAPGSRKRSGLGLAICRGFVEMHGGTIEAQSSAAGTRFTIRIPGCVG